MELEAHEMDKSETYLRAFDSLMGDKRTRRTFQGVVQGIISGESTKRSRLDADSVTKILREQGVANLRSEAELELVLDGMELRRPGAHAQENLMLVKDLDGGLVNGYHSFNVLRMGKEARGLLYHKLFSSNIPDFNSENVEIKAAINQTEQALVGYEGAKTWVIDRGFDNDDVWWEIWKHSDSHMVNRCTTWNELLSGKLPAVNGKSVIWMLPFSIWPTWQPLKLN